MSLKRLATVSMVALLVLSSASALYAQGQGRGRGGRGGGFFGSRESMRLNLLSVPKVQENLKLSDEQKSKAQAAVEQLNSERQKAFAGLQNASDEDRQKAFASLQEKTKSSWEEASKALSKEQLERLDQISLQAMGTGALNDETVAKTLMLTEEQQQKLRDVSTEVGGKMREIGFGEGTQEKRAELQKEMTDKSLAVLTDDQRAQFAKMQGEKIELPFGAGFGFGRGGRGRGRPQ
jgi:hypothetical protein